MRTDGGGGGWEQPHRAEPSPSGAAGSMKRLCEESSSDTESDGTIDVGREEEYR